MQDSASTMVMQHCYKAELKFNGVWEDFTINGTREDAAAVMRIAKEHGTNVRLTHTVESWRTEVTLCSGCRARPAEWERDMDGWYNVPCGKCNWYQAFTSRYPELKV